MKYLTITFELYIELNAKMATTDEEMDRLTEYYIRLRESGVENDSLIELGKEVK